MLIELARGRGFMLTGRPSYIKLLKGTCHNLQQLLANGFRRALSSDIFIGVTWGPEGQHKGRKPEQGTEHPVGYSRWKQKFREKKVREATHGAQVDEPLQQVQPGDYVYIKVFKRKHWSEPRREGPFKVVLATPTAVKVEGKEYWYHLNHCCRAAVKGPEWRKSRAELARCAHSDDSEDDDDGAGPAQDRGPAYRTRAKTTQPRPVEGEPRPGCSYQVDSRPPHDTLDSDKLEETVQRLLGNEENTVTPPEQFDTLNLQDLVDLDIDLPVEP
ncbi:uncharacterized protein LOC124378612 [Silurus meridionalis]|uniref:uncharacterized protein LOC124378612 n=1 Tax=Silurus meridionalis TaxID=175797 RepID=UPI001EEA0E32|nr:uncharacterized protein LOC124378612 [Silurus meridionalis]